jgi:nucleoside-diphosphate-sugar epimerase
MDKGEKIVAAVLLLMRGFEHRFFHRIAAKRPIPVPGSGLQVTQLGHVKDLADAFVKVLGNTKAANEIYNISGERFVTFDGIAKACAIAGTFHSLLL